MVSKKWFSVLAAAALCVGGCSSSGDPTAAPEDTASAKAPQVASLACTPLLTTTAPLLNCGALTATDLSLATSVQSSLVSQMQAAFANLTVTPNLAANQVVITSPASAFQTFFGSQIIAPLTPAGLFTASVPLTLGSLAPQFGLTASIFGAVPGLAAPITSAATIATPATIVSSTPLLAGASSTFTSTSSAISALNAASFNSTTLSASTMPLTFLISTPTTLASPLVCSGAIPLGCL